MIILSVYMLPEPLPPVTYDMSPPSYEESVQVINTGHGALNVVSDQGTVHGG